MAAALLVVIIMLDVMIATNGLIIGVRSATALAAGPLVPIAIVLIVVVSIAASFIVAYILVAPAAEAATSVAPALAILATRSIVVAVLRLEVGRARIARALAPRMASIWMELARVVPATILLRMGLRVVTPSAAAVAFVTAVLFLVGRA